MAKAIETLSIKLEFKDAGTQQIISKLSSSLKGMTNIVAGNTSPAISKLRKEILSVGQAGTKSISSFKNQRTALAALRDEARIGSATFKRLTEDIKKLDAQMAKAKPGSAGGGLGARATTQIAGAVVSGGIFGGPEGAIGALGGAALGGVQGAFAGAAIGAQVKGLRELASGAASYAADIEKLQIALKGVAGSQAEYSSAIEAAQDATERFNVPQRDAIAGITRLAAAVKGAGGPIEDAELTFKNVTAAIKATGGSTEDVRGAITAMVQVFSKGKVSAEELSGQLGERLPGAVTKFAEANDMTLPQLQENLKKGTVGLNELMNFIVALGDTYSGTAEKISNSNAEAGARLTVAIQNMQAEIGEALIPIGAEFQKAFAGFIEDITPFLVDNVPKIAKAFLELSKNLKPVLAGFATFVSIMTGAAIVSTITNLAAGLGLLGGAAKVAATGIGALTASMALNPLFGGALAVAGIVAGIVAVTNALGRQKRELQELSKLQPGQTYASLSNQERQEKISATQSLRATAVKELRDREAAGAGIKNEVEIERLEKKIAGFDKQLERLTRPVKKTKDETRDFKYDPVKPDGVSEGAGSAGTDNIANRVKAAQALERAQIARLNLAQSEGKISQLLAKQLNERENLQAKINDITEKGTNAEIERSIAAAQTTQATRQQAELQKTIEGLYEQAKKPIEDIVFKVKEQVELDKQRKKLLAEGVNPEIAEEIINITKARDAALRKFDVEILNLEAKAQQADISEKELQLIEDQIDALRRKKEAIEGDAAGAITDVRGTQEEASFTKELTEAIEEQKDVLKDLLNPINQVKAAAEAMGEAFSVSFRGILDGSMTGKEAMASFFQSISDHFMDMAVEIAKEAIKLAALQFVQFIFSSFSGGGGGGYSIPDAAVPKTSGLSFFSEGGAFANNKIVPYAKGGIVNKPTLFQYASGGSGNFGLMGEAGPEAIMPLRRGRNGKLGVESSGGVGNVVVNVDASGTQVQGDQPNAKSLGNAIGAAVQAELIKQKRPGGLLS